MVLKVSGTPLLVPPLELDCHKWVVSDPKRVLRRLNSTVITLPLVRYIHGERYTYNLEEVSRTEVHHRFLPKWRFLGLRFKYFSFPLFKPRLL